MDGGRVDQADAIVGLPCVPTSHVHIAATTVDERATYTHGRAIASRALNDDVTAVGVNVAVTDVHSVATTAHRRTLQHDVPTGAVDGVVNTDTRIISIGLSDGDERTGTCQAHKPVANRNTYPIACVRWRQGQAKDARTGRAGQRDVV